MQVTKEGSVRVDLTGGTLDLDPIALILPKVVTVNVATELMAKVTVSPAKSGIHIVSKDYQKTYQYSLQDFTPEKLYHSSHFGEMTFLCQLIDLFEKRPLEITLSSGAPPGSGLGGSSAMGVTLYQALAEFFAVKTTPTEVIHVVKATESRILNQGVAGYQDYYPALYGGILALHPSVKGVQQEQLYSRERAAFLEHHLTLVYSGKSRQSGMNNWEVYKAFFDKREETLTGMRLLAEASYHFYEFLKKGDFEAALEEIKKEGEQRQRLFPGIATSEMQQLWREVQGLDSRAGMKVCGAGGGGCFLLIHDPNSKNDILSLVKNHQMRELPFGIRPPLK